jgi:Flp pilus assembly protein TadG
LTDTSLRDGRRRAGHRAEGQSLVEFALAIPFLAVLFMGVIEFALAMGASLAVNRASQNGAHLAASAGNINGADCLILRQVDSDITAPNRTENILEVEITRTAMAGNQVYARQLWRRGGETPCVLPDRTEVVVPYSLDVAGYPEAQRCTVLDGCPLMTPARSTVDNVGVTVRYRHDWATPLQGALSLIASSGSGDGWEFEQRNIFRMEPTL